MTDPSTSTSDDKRALILQTTLDIIAERGLQNAPISLIAKRSGVSVGIIYHYFAGKDELLDVLHWEVKSRLAEAATPPQYGAGCVFGSRPKDDKTSGKSPRQPGEVT